MDNHDAMSEDPFRIYSLLKKKDKVVSNKDSEFSMKYPPGFTPNEGSDRASMHVEEGRGGNNENGNEGNVDVDNVVPSGNHFGMNSKEGGTESICSGYFKKCEVPRTGGSIMSLLDDVVKVGQVTGYKMDGCLAQKAKKDWVKELCVKNKVNFLALQETKMENMELFCVKTCWGNMAFDYVHSESVGNSGGILCVWDPNAFCKSSVTMSDYFIMVRGVWRQNGKDFLIIVVYAPHDIKEKMMLWDYLTREISRWKGEVVVMGDFNEVRNRSDRFGSVFNVQGANVFNSFISSAGLVLVSLGGCSFMWCHKSATKISKLDRFLVSESLINTCPNISAITLERYLSDHRLILLREYHFDYGPTLFRFFHYWFEMEGFSKIMEDSWKESPSDESNAMISMMGKLKFLKTKIREWNKTNMLCQKNVKAQCKADLEAVEVIIDSGNGNEEIAIKRTELVKNLQHIDKLNSLEIAQKAKVKWAIEGEENSSFSTMRFSKRLSLEQHVELEREVSNEEIKRAVWDCGSDKAPSPDGFTFGFYRYFWYLIENDVYNVVKYFFMHGEIPKGCNSSFIALIPKILDANLILDGPFILDELIQWCKRKKKQFLVFKVDFEKAYDSIRWDFLDDILRKFGFGEKLCKWIQSCLRSSRGSINLNRSPTEEFQFYKGLKQGDPLSPFLFILIMESLHLSFQWVKDARMFKGIKLGSSVSISHMFYADDAVFVGQWYESNINTLVHVLECFYRASGLRINMSKSKLMGLHVDSDKVKRDAIKRGCLTFKTPFTYLGSTVSLGVLRKLESIRSHFFNGHDPNCNKALWVNWKMVLAHKDKGGLSVSSLFALNRGLMFKWIWRFYMQDTFLWVRVIKAIYGEAGNMDAKVKAGPTSCWMSIVHEAKSLVNKCIDLFKFMHFKLGNGENARFWEDRSRSLVWPFRFKRSPRGGVEQEQFEELVMLVHDVRLVPMSDQWSWTLANSGEFSVASVRQLIDDKTLPEVDYKTRWIKYVPIKVNVLAWKVKSNSLPTRFNVSHRGILIDSIKCGICDTGGGNV
ncbi:RNA-directed DNA polymerase, eukaryota [Tanacetum coccineum]